MELLLALLLFAGAEPSLPDTNIRGAQSPRIAQDGSVTFTLQAPQASSVELDGGDGLGKRHVPLVKGADGVWSVTIPAPVPGFHYYWFVLDGVKINDPGSQTYFGYGREISGIEIPEAGADYYALRDVPHGEVRITSYFSKVTGRWRQAYVYTPAGYDRSPAARFPVLILQHGAGENETGWTRQGRANLILDNLIAAGKARPMIVVMDLGYAERPGAAPAAVGPGTPARNVRGAFQAFEDVVIEDLIPKIDATYRTIPDREHRAMAGLSMGGMQTLAITLHHLDKFAFIGSFSGPMIPGLNTGTEHAGFDPKSAYEGAFADADAFNRKVKLLWLGAGTEEPRLLSGIQSAAEALQGSGVRLVYFESKGTAHEWQTWRRALRDFVPRLFQ